MQQAPGLLQFAFMDLPKRDTIERAQQLHDMAIVVDTHCDTTQRLLDPTWNIAERHDHGHVDIPRLREGGCGAVFFAVWAPGPMESGAGLAAARRQVDCIRKTVVAHADDLALARSAGEIRAANEAGKIAIVIAIEGGYLIEDSLDVLREYRRLGAAYMTLTHGFHTSWADSSGIHRPLEPEHGGLTDFGREVVREMNRIGMMVDVSHVSDATFQDVLETAEKPVIATHSCCRALSSHPRNLSDDMMRALAATGGLVQINFAAGFLDPDFPDIDTDEVEAFFAAGCRADKPLTDHVTPLSLLVDHFDHALQTIGPDHVGIGSDFDGVPALPEGMEDCGKLVNLTAALLERGYDERDLVKVLGGNVLRVMDACRSAATDHSSTAPDATEAFRPHHE